MNGKIVTKRLTDPEAQLYQEWIGNESHIRALLARPDATVDAKATEVLKEAVNGWGAGSIASRAIQPRARGSLEMRVRGLEQQ